MPVHVIRVPPRILQPLPKQPRLSDSPDLMPPRRHTLLRGTAAPTPAARSPAPAATPPTTQNSAPTPASAVIPPRASPVPPLRSSLPPPVPTVHPSKYPRRSASPVAPSCFIRRSDAHPAPAPAAHIRPSSRRDDSPEYRPLSSWSSPFSSSHCVIQRRFPLRPLLILPLNLLPRPLPHSRQLHRLHRFRKLHRRKPRRPQQRIHQRPILHPQPRHFPLQHPHIPPAHILRQIPSCVSV